MQDEEKIQAPAPHPGGGPEAAAGEGTKAPLALRVRGATGVGPEAGGPGSGGTRVGPLRSVFVKGYTSVFGRG